MAWNPLDQDPNATEVTVPGELRAAKVAERQILVEIEKHRFPEACCFAIKLALEEAITNAIRHGNHNDTRKHITLRYRITPEKAAISVADEGRGFKPNDVPDPTLDENLNKPSGRGIMLMRAYMDEVGFNDTGTEVRLVKFNRR
ncbi:MAG: ATP-binding protein [Phycisphaerae bacterium]|nr:ATP-binding protein [Phycisphaerae bacterium]